MAKTRKKHTRSRRAHSQLLEPSPPQPAKREYSSAILFFISFAIFAHQCLVPLFLHATLNKVAQNKSDWKPRVWYSLRGDENESRDDGIGLHDNDWNGSFAEQAENNMGHRNHGNGNRSGAATLAAMPDGPIPLPELAVNATQSVVTAGASWTGSLAQGVLSALPLHWVAEMLHRAPQKKEEIEEREGSIFTARRKGKWMGCERDFHLVCKGIYRAIKVINAVTVADVGCLGNVGWLPHVIGKLREEFRLVTVTCIAGDDKEEQKVRELYGGVEGVNVLKLDPFAGKFPNGTDLLVAYRFLESGNLIDAMRFFKNLKKGGSVSSLAVESYSTSRNVPSENEIGGRLRMNTALAPFWFPPPVYAYENADENPPGPHMRIITVKVGDMFERRVTPQMKDLVDPRKREVVE